jgi:hypothetical protein
MKGRRTPGAKAFVKPEAEWRRVCAALARDRVRVSVPRAFLSTLTLLFHHVSDAMWGDDRPDHGLAKMRQGRDYYDLPFYVLYGRLRRAEQRMRTAQHRKSLQQFQRYRELSKQREAAFRERIQHRH